MVPDQMSQMGLQPRIVNLVNDFCEEINLGFCYVVWKLAPRTGIPENGQNLAAR